MKSGENVFIEKFDESACKIRRNWQDIKHYFFSLNLQSVLKAEIFFDYLKISFI